MKLESDIVYSELDAAMWEQNLPCTYVYAVKH